MKKNLLFIVLLGHSAYAQSNYEHVQKEINEIKQSITLLKNDIQQVKAENISLKKTLDITKPILQQEKENISLSVINVDGNKSTKQIKIELIIEAIDENTRIGFSEFSVIDLMGNEFTPEKHSTIQGLDNLGYSNFFKNIPKKIIPIIVQVDSNSEYIKLLTFVISTSKESKKDKFADRNRLEFRDLKIDWK